MKSLYVYPIANSTKSSARNPYINDLVNALSQSYIVVNKNESNNIGIFQAYKFIFRAEAFLFNWPENIIDRKFGFIQSIFYVLLLLILKLLNKKIVLTLHNKKSHSDNNIFSNYLLSISIKISSKIITHAKEGLKYLSENYGSKSVNKAVFFPHPIKKVENLNRDIITQYSYIIWGSIEPYKGIVDFLKFFQTSVDLNNQKLLICGQCNDSQYAAAIEDLASQNSNITFINKFISDEDLKSLIQISDKILFTYLPDTVLSSGSLSYSLAFLKPIIGPNVGSFTDLCETELIRTYDSLDEISKLKFESINYEKVNEYLNEYSWEKFIPQIDKIVY